MKFQQMLEVLRMHFPEVGETLAKVRLNQLARVFTGLTKIYVAQVTVALSDSISEYDIPENIYAITDITFFDVNDVLVEGIEYAIDDEMIYTYIEEELSPPYDAAYMIVEGYAYPTDLGTIDSQWEFRSEFHMAPVAKFLSELYSNKDLKRSLFWENEYAKYVRDATKIASRRGSS